MQSLSPGKDNHPLNHLLISNGRFSRDNKVTWHLQHAATFNVPCWVSHALVLESWRVRSGKHPTCVHTRSFRGAATCPDGRIKIYQIDDQIFELRIVTRGINCHLLAWDGEASVGWWVEQVLTVRANSPTARGSSVAHWLRALLRLQRKITFEKRALKIAIFIVYLLKLA